MRVWKLLTAAVCGCVAIVGAARAETAQPAWVARAEALAERIEREDLVLKADSHREHEARADAQGGEERLQTLFDIAVEDFVSSDAIAAEGALSRLRTEAHEQHNLRYLAMADVLTAYAPSLDGNYLGARENLARVLNTTQDVHVRAAADRLYAYALTDLGLFGNALEAARDGLVHLPDQEGTSSLRAGLHDAVAYNALRVHDYDLAVEHLERIVEISRPANVPIDGTTIIYNVATMLAERGEYQAALHMVEVSRRLAARMHSPASTFFADLLCARINFHAGNFEETVQCADRGRANAAAPVEYLTRLLLLRAQALARLQRAQDARAAYSELKALTAQRGDPALEEQLDLVLPQVLAAEHRYGDAYAKLFAAHNSSQEHLLTRFNDGVRELRANMESELAQADQRAHAERVRMEFQEKALHQARMIIFLAAVSLIGLLGLAVYIFRSRRAMLHAVARAENILGNRDGVRTAESEVARSPRQKLDFILDEISRKDAELARAFDELNRARLAAEEASVAKSHFLATMSHELRTPLNAILGYTEILEEEALAQDHAALEDSARIKRAAQHLLALIGDVLDFSKINSGAVVLNPSMADVTKVVRNAADLARPMALTKGLRFDVECADDLGVVCTDALRFKQCLVNLMSNAVKFTDTGSVSIRATKCAANGPARIRVEVRDTGCGIAAEKLEQVFEPFKQVDGSMARRHEGTGLGLSISRHLARALGGDLTAKSTLGEGSTFVLEIAELSEADFDASAKAA